MADFSFSKNEKLKSKKQIELLFKEGNSVSVYPIKLIYIALKDTKDSQLAKIGVTVPKRVFKSAVQRNRIKRVLRECYRLNKHIIFNNIEGNFALLFLYLGKEMPAYDKVEKAMIATLQKFINNVQ